MLFLHRVLQRKMLFPVEVHGTFLNVIFTQGITGECFFQLKYMEHFI